MEVVDTGPARTHEPGHEVDPVRVIVAEKRMLSRDVVLISLVGRERVPLPAWTPGSHITLLLPNGMERQYSLCGEADRRGEWRIAVLREPGGRGGSRYVHDDLRVGDQLEAQGPRNNFPLLPASRYVFVAGGIGITPLLPMIADVEARGGEWELHYGARDEQSFCFRERLQSYGTRVRMVSFDRAGPLDLELIDTRVAPGTSVYCCGPSGLIDALQVRASTWSPGTTLNVERFHAPEPSDPTADRPITVHLALSGLTIRVAPGESILGAMRREGVDVPSSCEEGTCGTCETRVLAGIPDHRDGVLTPLEQETNEYMMVCVSRALTAELELDA